MNIGYIGLGRMGLNMVYRMLEKGHDVVVFNRSPKPIEDAKKAGAKPAHTLDELISMIPTPRVIWVMVLWQAVDEVLDELIPKLAPGDTIIDGGNSLYIHSQRRASELAAKNINFIDAGVSGGPSGARNGTCMMIGGKKEDFDRLEPLFKDLSVDNGYGYMGLHGAGHFVKMIHNGIEYGMMQAIGEGFEILHRSEFNLNLTKVADLYNHGSVIESRLIGWLKKAYADHGEELENITGEISQSGEGQWTVETAHKLNVPVPVIKGSLDFRFASQGNPSYTGQVVSALRNQFGSHDVSRINKEDE